jgi:hypothetical protein
LRAKERDSYAWHQIYNVHHNPPNAASTSAKDQMANSVASRIALITDPIRMTQFYTLLQCNLFDLAQTTSLN